MQKMECQLCLEKHKLQRSHIIPNFFRDHSGTTYPTGQSQQAQPFTVITNTKPGNKVERKQHGFYEKKLGLIEFLLCSHCEQKLSKYEDYFKRYFYGGTDPIRFRIPLKADPFFEADYSKMKLFLLSILWRAAVANGKFFEEISIPSRDKEFLRYMLLHENPREDCEYFCSISRLVPSKKLDEIFKKHSISVETAGFAPVKHDFEGYSTYTFIVGGLVLSFCISSIGVPSILRNTYIKKSGRFYLSPMKADQFFEDYSKKVISSGNLTYSDVLKDIEARKRI